MRPVRRAQSQPFTTEPELAPGPTSTPPPPPPLPAKPFPKVCPAPGVMQGCLESTSGLIMLPDSQSALVAERTTGAVKEVAVQRRTQGQDGHPGRPSGDGGLMDIVLSPTYSQDRLMYAYVSTPTDNRVIRIADGDVPKPILTGIPKGATGNTRFADLHQPDHADGADRRRGRPRAGRRSRLAGRQGAAHRAADDGRPGAATTTALSGLGAGGGMCIDPSDESLYVTDRTPTADRLQRITKDSKVSTVWTLAGPSRRGGLRRARRHGAGQPRQHQADRRRAAWRPTPAR